jgi:hypothetical protein
MAHKMRCGKGYELTVLGLLTLADFDVYAPLVDDQGIDGIIRIHGGDKRLKYYDLQIKGSKSWNGIRCKVGTLPRNGVLILFCDGCKEVLWFLQDEAMKLFPAKDPEWGDIFLSAERVEQFKADNRGDLSHLHQRLFATRA